MLFSESIRSSERENSEGEMKPKKVLNLGIIILVMFLNSNAFANEPAIILNIKKNNIEEVKKLIESAIDVNIEGEEGKTPLCWAASLNALDIARLLIKNGADVNIGGWYHDTPLVEAARHNFLEMAELLIDNGANINPKNKFSPLEAAARSNSVEVAKLLLSKGADINAKDHRYYTALMEASEANSTEVAKLLIENGANVNDGAPLCSVAAFNKIDMAKLLLEKGADVNIRDESTGKTPLIIVAEISVYGEDVKGKIMSEPHGMISPPTMNLPSYLPLAKLLIDNGAGINIKDESGRTALMYAASCNSLKIAKLLIDNGADVNADDGYGRTVLDYASELEVNPEMIELLEKHGAKQGNQTVHKYHNNNSAIPETGKFPDRFREIPETGKF